MRRFWFFAVALLLLWLDVFIITDRAYPVYQKSKDYGWKTQDFVMNDVVGTKLPIDVASDILALVILIVLVLTGGPKVTPFMIEDLGEGKRKYIASGKAQKLGQRKADYDLLAIIFAIASIAAILVERFTPFVVNGPACYATEYLVRIADVFLPLLTVFFVFAEWIRRTEIRTTHRETDASGFAMMVSLFCGFISRFADLYCFKVIHYAAWAIEGLLMLVAIVLHYISTRENGRKLAYPDPDPETNPDYKFEEELQWNLPFHFPFR